MTGGGGAACGWLRHGAYRTVMTDWTAGYVADIGYTFGYYSELNPLRVRLALLHAGYCPPEVTTACELGFGQGVSVNIHAAAAPVRWHGTDFNPAHAVFGRELADSSGAHADLGDDSFAEFARRTDLPAFDFIGLHGVWSWISDENRATIVELASRRLKPGGVLYISYNTMPGWALFAPMRRLMTEHAAVLGAEGQGIVGRIDGALGFAERLVATAPGYLRANPLVEERLKQMKEHNRNYLAHEYFNRDWLPMHFADMAKWLAPAKLTYVCSAHFLDHVEAMNHTQDQRDLLKEIPDRLFRETVRDFMSNQQFRRDYWIKGGRRLSYLEQAEALRRERVVLCTPRGDIKFSLTGALGEVTMSGAIYAPILDAMADHQPKTIAALEQIAAAQGFAFPLLLEAVLVLVGKGDLAPALEDAVAAQARPRTDRLNRHLMKLACSGSEVPYLASPVTGGAVGCNRLEQMYLLAASQGHPESEWPGFAWRALSLLGQKLIDKGRLLASTEENLAELSTQTRAFADGRWPVLKALQVV